MKLIIIAACLVACVCAYPAADESTAETLENTYDINSDGSYSWKIKTSNNIESQARGNLISLPDGEVVLVAEGSNSYYAPNGEQISLTYKADENGYVPYGDHLPVPPPTPDSILRALNYIASRQAAQSVSE